MLIAAYSVGLAAASAAIGRVSRLHHGIAAGFIVSGLLTISVGALLNPDLANLLVLAGAAAVALAVGAHLLANPMAEPRRSTERRGL